VLSSPIFYARHHKSPAANLFHEGENHKWESLITGVTSLEGEITK
jgi:hypothetical protein